MFCSWKSERGGGCSCAYRFRKPIAEVLNHLCCIGPSTLIIRRPGLTVAKATRFGLHISEPAHDWTVLKDAVSGLQTDLRPKQEAFLLREFPDQCPIFAIAVDGCSANLTVRLDGHTWGDSAIQSMIEQLDGVALNCAQSHQLGAGAWLDEWELPRAQTSAPENRLTKACEILHRCKNLSVEIRTASQQCGATFAPSFVDHEGSVIRIADRKRHHVVYADVQAAGFCLTAVDEESAHLYHTD